MTKPLKIVVVGNSLCVQEAPARRDHGQGTFPEQLRSRLAERGIPADVAVSGRWFGFLSDAWRDYEPFIRNAFPDVLIIQHGANEYHPHIMPIPVMRHLLAHREALTPLGRWYRREVSARVLNVVRTYRRAVSRRIGLRTWQMSPAHFDAMLTTLIADVRRDCRPLVLVLDIDKPSAILEAFLPGVGARRDVFQALIERIVGDFEDDEVRLVPVAAVVEEYFRKRPSLDGAHYDAVLHDRIAGMLEEHVLSWLASREPSARPERPPEKRLVTAGDAPGGDEA